MVLYTKSIYAPIEESDGIRVCIMSRLTQDDGTTPVKDLVEGELFDYWAKILAPPPKLVGSWYRQEIDWNEFSRQYLHHLSREDIMLHVSRLAQQALEGDMTILCVEETPDNCHRKLLAEECKRLDERIGVVIK